MKILITGAYGQLGNALKRELEPDNSIETIFTDADTLDLTDSQALSRFFEDNNVDMVVNCAAYTAVDRAESDDLKAAAINTGAVGNLGQVAAKHGMKVIHISTDYVFSGESFRPYEENDEPYPQSIYGRTKLEGEGLLTSFSNNAMIVRTAWLYSEFGNNFVKTMLRLADERDEIKVVCDQIGTPTYAGDLAHAIHQVISHNVWQPGIYHFTDEGVASWFDFTKAIMEYAGKKTRITPIRTAQYPTPAKRPSYSVLSKDKIKRIYGIEIPYWRDSLQRCLANLNAIKN